MGYWTPSKIAASVLGALINGLFIPTMAVNGWIYSGIIGKGLYNTCGGGICTGTQWGQIAGEDATRIMYIIAAIVLGLKLFISIGYCVTKNHAPLMLGFGICEVAAGIIMFAGSITYVRTFAEAIADSNGGSAFGVAFYLSWFAAIISIIAGCFNIHVYSQCKNNSSEVNVEIS
uniref:Uncharacterized LOC100181662 n=1 Tax=Ciona intestinalis TaxID=7719 RepID=F6UKJ4_CIOIN|nr:uncharacterized protein LOC100181662 [Ciona intestinalis]|eukprot:XP_026691048.1 uncharacterized protein LOC100181662 [Ciona intestinalis]